MGLKTLKEWYEFNKPYLPAGYDMEIYLYKKIVTKKGIELKDHIFKIDILNYSNRMESVVKTFGSWIIGKIQSDLTKFPSITKIYIVDPANVQDYEKQEEGD